MKKGFTLIELLAVIIILAIISLLVTPIVLDVIESSRKSATESSAAMVFSVVKNYYAEHYFDESFTGYECNINDKVGCDEIKFEGERPDTAILTVDKDGIVGGKVVYGKYTYYYCNGKLSNDETQCDETYTYAKYTPGTLIQYDPVNNTKCTTGDTCYNWNVITVGDTTSKSKIALQLDHNFDIIANWMDTGYKVFPDGLFSALESETATWNDALKLNYTYDTSNIKNNYGVLTCTSGVCSSKGGDLSANVKARVITMEEVVALTMWAGAADNSVAGTWSAVTANGTNGLFSFAAPDRIIGTKEQGTGTTTLSWLSGTYVTLTTTSGAWNRVWIVQGTGITQGSGNDIRNPRIRPVIEVSKSVIE